MHENLPELGTHLSPGGQQSSSVNANRFQNHEAFIERSVQAMSLTSVIYQPASKESKVEKLARLIAELKQAKQHEKEANEYRLGLETQIVALFPPQTGEATVKQDDLTITYKSTRSVDSEGVQNAWNGMSANAQKAFKVKFDLDLKQYRAINELDAATAQIINQYITSKPSKPTITLKETNGI